MLKSTFDATKPLRYVRYGRMSDPGQNLRSPQQQFDGIDRGIVRRGFPWIHVGDYQDDYKSGRLILRRPALQKLLSDIRLGLIQTDLIIVHTAERFGRNKALAAIRMELENKYGVLVLSADSDFCDPTSSTGKLLWAIEDIRSTEENRVKSTHVLRGKRDAVEEGHWPGGPRPFGARIKKIFLEVNGQLEYAHSILEVDEIEARIILIAFEIAGETGWGQLRVADYLNQHPEIPNRFKPFCPATVGRWLKSEFYTGTLVWNLRCTDIIYDSKVSQPNDSEEIIRKEKFWPGIVPRELWEKVNAVRRRRAESLKGAQRSKEDKEEKLITPVAPGLPLNYPLSGLATCGECGRSMIANSTGIYTTTAGEAKKYTAYVCPGHLDHVCGNAARIPEDQLRKWVIETLMRRLSLA